jgi:hypothetical protein
VPTASVTRTRTFLLDLTFALPWTTPDPFSCMPLGNDRLIFFQV